MSSSISESIPVSPARKSGRRIVLRGLIPLAIILAALGLYIGGWRPVDVAILGQSMGPAAPIAFAVIGSLMMSMLVPKTVVSLSAGALFGVAVGSVTLTVTAIVAAGINYCIGRWWLGEWVADRQGDRWAVVRGLADDAGFVTHFLLRLTPVPTSAISYSMGAARSRLRPFLLAAAAGSIPQWMWVWCGAATSSAMQPGDGASASLSRWIGVAISATAAIGLAGILPGLATKKIRELDQASPVGRDSPVTTTPS